MASNIMFLVPDIGEAHCIGSFLVGVWLSSIKIKSGDLRTRLLAGTVRGFYLFENLKKKINSINAPDTFY